MSVKLFCIPYAGGFAFAYNNWKKMLSPEIELIPVELAGRGMRYKQANYNCLDDAVLDILQVIEHKITNEPYMIFGHSMGAVILYELYYKIKHNLGHNLPCHLFFSGAKPPFMKNDEWANLDHDGFILKLKEYGGTSEEVFKNKEAFNLFLPIIRKDIENLTNYQFKPYLELINCNATIMGGTDDKLASPGQLKEWEKLFSGKVNTKIYKGGHFYLFEYNEEIVTYFKTFTKNMLPNT